jgi:hypothetical protein
MYDSGWRNDGGKLKHLTAGYRPPKSPAAWAVGGADAVWLKWDVDRGEIGVEEMWGFVVPD